MSLKDDMIAMHDPDIFAAVADEVVWTPSSSGTPKTKDAVFERQYSRLEFDGDVQVESYYPAVCFLAPDVTGVPETLERGDTISPDGFDYTVIELQPTGNGLIWAILERA